MHPSSKKRSRPPQAEPWALDRPWAERSKRYHDLPLLLLLLALWSPQEIGAEPVRIETGDVLVGVEQGQILHFDPEGNLRQTLDNRSGAVQTGMCIDLHLSRIYTTNFSSNSASTFTRDGRLESSHWGGPFDQSPESCVIDREGRVLVGQADGRRDVLRFSPEGEELDRFSVRTGGRGTDWIDLAGDQCTLVYTSEGSTVFRHDICRDQALDPLAEGLAGPCYALRVRPNGEVLVTCANQVYRLGDNGSTLQTYPMFGHSLFAMNIDPDGRTFWTAGQLSGDIFRVDIETGAGAERPVFNISGGGSGGFLESLGFGGHTVGGLAIYGERTAAAKASGFEDDARQRFQGSLSLGEDLPTTVDFGQTRRRQKTEAGAELPGAEIEGVPWLRLGTDFDWDGAVLEVKTAEGWRRLRAAPIEVPVDFGGGRELPLRVRAGDCPAGTAELGEDGGYRFEIQLETANPGEEPQQRTIAGRVEILGATWLQCWWPFLLLALLVLLVLIVIHGYTSPSRFSRRVGLMLSPEEEMEEGFFHPIRAQRGTGRGFYRDARVYICQDFRLSGSARGALVCIRAEGKRAKIRPMPGCTVLLQSVDGEWETLPPGESPMRFGMLYCSEGRGIFFELRNG